MDEVSPLLVARRHAHRGLIHGLDRLADQLRRLGTEDQEGLLVEWEPAYTALARRLRSSLNEFGRHLDTALTSPAGGSAGPQVGDGHGSGGGPQRPRAGHRVDRAAVIAAYGECDVDALVEARVCEQVWASRLADHPQRWVAALAGELAPPVLETVESAAWAVFSLISPPPASPLPVPETASGAELPPSAPGATPNFAVGGRLPVDYGGWSYVPELGGPTLQYSPVSPDVRAALDALKCAPHPDLESDYATGGVVSMTTIPIDSSAHRYSREDENQVLALHQRDDIAQPYPAVPGRHDGTQEVRTLDQDEHWQAYLDASAELDDAPEPSAQSSVREKVIAGAVLAGFIVGLWGLLHVLNALQAGAL